MIIHGVDSNNLQVPLLLGANGQVLLYGSNPSGVPVVPLLGANGEIRVYGIDGSSNLVSPLLGSGGQLVAYGLNGANSPTKLLIDADGRLTVTRESYQHGYISGAWQKQPIQQGYSAVIRGNYVNSDLAAGTNTISGATVPAGEIWIVEAVSAYYNGTVATVTLRMYVNSSSVDYTLVTITTVVSGIWYPVVGSWSLAPGENLALIIANATIHNSANFRYLARRVDIDL